LGWSYGKLATEVYELDTPIGHSFGDVEYYLRHLAGISGRILEPAVGTGRMLIPMLETGLKVDGFDPSPEMLTVCRQHCRDRNVEPDLWQRDMTTFVKEAAYAAVIVPAGSIMLLDGRDDTLRALACFRESLGPTGRLMVDVPSRPPVLDKPEPMRFWRLGSHVWTLQTMLVEYDFAANQTTQWLRYEKWREGTLVATELQQFRLQHWGMREFEQLLFEAGFKDITLTGDYRADPEPGRQCDLWTFVATLS
jgi:SAM-dependent methyltransferase